MMTNQALEKVSTEWTAIAPVFAIPSNEAEYQARLAMLDELLDLVGEDDAHPLASLLDTVGIIVAAYEDAHYHLPDVSAIEVLKALMTEHQLKQTDLPEIGSQGVVSEILSGKRQLNVRQIQALSERFKLSPAVFLN